jgi:O-antigen ligase
MDVKTILKNEVFIIIFLNTTLVILGYGVISILGDGYFTYVKILRSVILILGFLYVLKANGIKMHRIQQGSFFFFFSIMLLLCSIFYFGNDNVVYNLLTFLLGFFYLLFSVNYLLRFDIRNLLSAFSIGIFCCFSLVILSYFIFGGSLSATNIYGASDEGGFVSNHYGWSASLLILATIDIIKNFRLSNFIKIILGAYTLLLFYILVISASRSGMLAVGLSIVFIVFKNKSIKPIFKIIIISIPLVLFIFFENSENSAINFVVEKSQKQLSGEGDGRLESAQIMFEVFNGNAEYWIVGVGMFNVEYLDQYGSILGKYHNSYLEILFGSGILVFLVFLNFMLFKPLKQFWNGMHNYSMLFFPLLIIPFFESDITPGQFLFFPWFGYMFILNRKYSIPIRMKQQRLSL